VDGCAVTLHTLRFASATHLIRRGVDVSATQELLSYAGLQITARYLGSDARTKQAAAGRLAEAFTGDVPAHG
jgi:site-specific recombinase XerD